MTEEKNLETHIDGWHQQRCGAAVAGVRVEIIHLEMCPLIIMKMGGKGRTLS
jgi:hypothetical protein